MATSLNTVFLLGNAGQDPEQKTFESNNSVTTFTVATNEAYKDKAGQPVEKVIWHTVKVWGKYGDVVLTLVKKGTKVHVSGKIEYEEFEGKDGVKNLKAVIIADNVIVLTPKEKEAAA